MNAVINMQPDLDRYLAVGDHVVDMDTLRLLSAPDGARLTPKATAVLLRLARAGGRTLSREELLNDVWKGTCPTPDVLTQAVKDLRRALGDDLQAPRYVETLPRLGYRLVAEARFVSLDDRAPVSKRAPVEAVSGSGLKVVAHAAKSRIGRIGAALAIGVLLVAMVVLALAFAPSTSPPDGIASPAPRWQIADMRAITADPGAERVPRISPDGTRVAYAIGDADLHSSRIVQRALDSPRVVGLSDVPRADETYPVWSPDGTKIAYMRYIDEQCEVLTEPVLGGPADAIGPCSGGLLDYFSWTPDSRHLAMARAPPGQRMARAITLVPVDGGGARQLDYQRDEGDIDLDPRYSPDGSRIAFLRGVNPYSDLYVMDAQGGAVRPLTHLASRIRGFDWTRDGAALVFSSGHAGPQALYTVSLEDGRIDALGVQPAEFPSSARATDTVVYEILRERTQLVMIALDDSVAPSRDLVPSTGNDGAPVLSPVDGRMAFVSDRGGAQQVWLHDPVSGETFALTDVDEPNLRYPVWRADGARLLVTARGEGWGRLIEIDIATRRRTVLTSEEDDVRYGTYGTAPGRYAAVMRYGQQTRELVEFGSKDGRSVSRRVLARDVGRIDYDHAGAALYFTRVNRRGLFRLDSLTGAETLVPGKIDPVQLEGWFVLAGRVYYIAPHATGRGDIHMIDPATGVDSRLAAVPGNLADLNFSISRDRSRAVVVRSAWLDNDVGAIELTRTDAASAVEAAGD